jgi:hypothetical protein
MSDLPSSPAAERNRLPILQALQSLLPAGGSMLEVASGTGQHAAWLSNGLPGWEWQPTEANSAALPTIAAWARETHAVNVRPPCLLDVNDREWPSDDETLASAFRLPFDAMFCANMLHIAPWAACLGLMAGAARHLKSGGLLLIYGPFFEDGVAPAPGNLGFDASLRQQSALWGIRQREAVDQAAEANGLLVRQRIEMPANNLLLVYQHVVKSAA